MILAYLYSLKSQSCGSLLLGEVSAMYFNADLVMSEYELSNLHSTNEII